MSRAEISCQVREERPGSGGDLQKTQEEILDKIQNALRNSTHIESLSFRAADSGSTRERLDDKHTMSQSNSKEGDRTLHSRVGDKRYSRYFPGYILSEPENFPNKRKTKKVTKCEHKHLAHYSIGLCQGCYLTKTYQNKKEKVPKPEGESTAACN